MVVASLVDGRVRIRDEGLKREPLVTRVREALLGAPGVSAVEANPRVGSLLILYSAALTAVEQILKTVSDLLGSGAEEGGAAESGKTTAEPGKATGKFPFTRKLSFAMPSVMKRRVVNNIGMLASLALSLAAVIFHLKKIHVLAGIVFVALFGVHLFERRQQVFA